MQPEIADSSKHAAAGDASNHDDAQAEAAAYLTERFLSSSTAKERLLHDVYHAPDTRFQPICTHLTLEQCAADPATSSDGHACDAVHFAPIIYPQTDPGRGHCSYLNTCHRTGKCRYLHFQPVRRPGAPPFEWRSIYDDDPMPARTSIDKQQQGLEQNVYGYSQSGPADDERKYIEAPLRHPKRALYAHGLQQWTRDYDPKSEGIASAELTPAQWIDADLKTLDYSILGKFDIIVADPPWDIHMSLPYGTMSDDDMRTMPVSALQDEGFLFLWVTGRAMELGRELLAIWGYTRVDEIVWIKIGQTQRLIRTGRTGHWLNHTKEHCLVGVKTMNSTLPKPDVVPPATANGITYPGSHAPGIPRFKLLPSWAHAGIDADVIVAEVRDTSRKPDELYSMIERLCPGGRKIELFGRRHNARPGWLTVGNQLKGDHIVDAELASRVAAWRSAGSGDPRQAR